MLSLQFIVPVDSDAGMSLSDAETVCDASLWYKVEVDKTDRTKGQEGRPFVLFNLLAVNR